jgi:hypothetical protein
VAVYTLEAGLPALELPGGSFLRLEAIHPTTGVAITGVSVTDIAVYGYGRELGRLLELDLPKLTPDELAGVFD